MTAKDEGARAVHVLWASREVHRFVRAVGARLAVAFPGGVLVVGEGVGHGDVDAADRVDGRLERLEVEADPMIDVDAEEVLESAVGDGRAGAPVAGWQRSLAADTVRVGLVDATVVGLPGAELVGHVPVTRDADLRHRRRAGRLRLHRDDHDRIGQVGAVVARATVPVEGKVDPPQVAVGGVDRRAVLATDQVADDAERVLVGQVGQAENGSGNEDPGHEDDRRCRQGDHALGAEPARLDVVTGAAAPRRACHLCAR